jgi:DNA adenine methylase
MVSGSNYHCRANSNECRAHSCESQSNVVCAEGLPLCWDQMLSVTLVIGACMALAPGLLRSAQYLGTFPPPPLWYSYRTLQRPLKRSHEEHTRFRCPAPHSGMTGPLAYVGGKNRIAKQIIALFPEHKTFVEPFAGGAQVLFHKVPSKVEVLNDLDHEVVNFFRICQHHHPELLRYLKFSLVSRRWFTLFQNENPEALTEIQRAVRFFFCQKNGFAGLVRKPHYRYSVGSTPSFNPLRVNTLIDNAHARLARVQIECLPYEEILRRFDGSETLFYLDPPYFRRYLYHFNFTDADFRTLSMRLRTIRGKFVLSLNDAPEIRKWFAGFFIRDIELHYTAQRKAGKRFRELIITNFSLTNETNQPTVAGKRDSAT